MTTASTDILAGHIAERLRRLSELRDLGRRQMEVIEQDDIAQLLKLLAAKGRLIEQVREIERRLDPFRNQDPNDRRWTSDEVRTRCARQAELCRRLLDEIVVQERQSEARLSARRDQIAVRLEQMHDAAQVHAAYLAQDRTASQAVDVRSNIP